MGGHISLLLEHYKLLSITMDITVSRTLIATPALLLIIITMSNLHLASAIRESHHPHHQ